MENNKMNLKNFDLSEELYKLKSEIESEKEKNKSLSAQKAEIESCLNLLQKEKSLLKQELALNPHQELTKLQNECEESKNTILALRNEIKSYQEDLEMQQTEKNNLLAIKESLLRDMENLDLKLSLSNDEYQKVIENLHKAEIDSSDINAKLSNLKDQMKIMEKDFERERYESKDQYLKLQKDHEEALKFSSEQDLRIKETFAAFISVNNQLKSEQAQRVEIEQKLRKALDKNNALIDLNLKDELVNIQNKLNISEERLLSMGNKCAELEKESERKESEYLEELEEADSNFEELLEKYEKLSQKAILLETLYSKTQSDFSNRRQAIL
jgi:chromosome segregation ATPase